MATVLATRPLRDQSVSKRSLYGDVPRIISYKSSVEWCRRGTWVRRGAKHGNFTARTAVFPPLRLVKRTDGLSTGHDPPVRGSVCKVTQQRGLVKDISRFVTMLCVSTGIHCVKFAST